MAAGDALDDQDHDGRQRLSASRSMVIADVLGKQEHNGRRSSWRARTWRQAKALAKHSRRWLLGNCKRGRAHRGRSFGWLGEAGGKLWPPLWNGSMGLGAAAMRPSARGAGTRLGQWRSFGAPVAWSMRQRWRKGELHRGWKRERGDEPRFPDLTLHFIRCHFGENCSINLHNFVTNTYISCALLAFESWDFIVKGMRVKNHNETLKFRLRIEVLV